MDTNGVVVAHREYDPFGNTIVATGPMVNDFSFWFSTKYLDQETGLYYYGYRYYSPGMGRWLSRDPIGEFGGLNLYGFVGNRPISRIDPKGLFPTWGSCVDAGEPDVLVGGWGIYNFSFDDIEGGESVALVMRMTFNYRRDFKRKYKCCCNEVKWADDGKRGFSKTDNNTNLGVARVEGIGPWVPEPVLLLQYINHNKPSDDELGSIVQEPTPPTSFCW